jgi:hypothetical protein
MKFEYSDAAWTIIVLMRILARWAWIPLAITVACVVYLFMVKLANFEAAAREPQAVRDAPKPFVMPPAPVKHKPEPIPAAPNVDARPFQPASPALPKIELPPFHPPAKK